MDTGLSVHGALDVVCEHRAEGERDKHEGDGARNEPGRPVPRAGTVAREQQAVAALVVAKDGAPLGVVNLGANLFDRALPYVVGSEAAAGAGANAPGAQQGSRAARKGTTTPSSGRGSIACRSLCWAGCEGVEHVLPRLRSSRSRVRRDEHATAPASNTWAMTMSRA